MAEGAARIAAIDLGASSGRVIAGHGTEQGFTLREIHRFPNRPRLVDGVLDSMAVAIRHAVRDAARLTGQPVNTVHVNGGGAANPLFCQLVANARGLPTVAGPTEAASWGNALVQARALGVVGGSLPELRSFVRRSVHLTRYEPDEQETAWEHADEVVLASRAPVPRGRPCSKRGETVS